MAAPTVSDVRLSLIWTQTHTQQLGNPQPVGGMNWLGRRVAYAARFSSVAALTAPLDGLSAPWPRPSGQLFWTRYLGGTQLGDMPGDTAWMNLVPFRTSAHVTLKAPWLLGRVVVEGFYYPHGSALVVTALSSNTGGLAEAVEFAFQVRRHGAFGLTWRGGAGESMTVTLPEVANVCLERLAAEAVGAQAPILNRTPEPFTVLTVVKGQGADSTMAVPQDGEIHRALEAMCSWSPGWKTQTLTPLALATIKARAANAAGDIVYGRPRGRAVWFPRLFQDASPGGHALGCYHRNLTLLTMQVESLSALVQATAVAVRGPARLPVAHIDCATFAGDLLGRLYSAATDVYRSWSPRAQIDQNAMVTPINAVRDAFGMPPVA